MNTVTYGESSFKNEFLKEAIIMRFFKRRTDKPTKAELESLVEYYNGLTAELPHDWALEKLDSERRCHFLMLLKIAEYADMGKLKSIIYAFKIGYLYANGKIALGLPDYENGKDGADNEKHL